MVIGIIDLDDIFVAPFSEGFGFLDEAFGVFGFVPMAGIDDFDGDFAVEFDIVGKVDLGHTATADNTFKTVVSKLLADEWVLVRHGGS